MKLNVLRACRPRINSGLWLVAFVIFGDLVGCDNGSNETGATAADTDGAAETGVNCEPAQEGIELDELFEPFVHPGLSDAACEVTEEGIVCDDLGPFAVAEVFGEYAPAPWSLGDAVRLTTDGTETGAELVVRTQGGDFLALLAWGTNGGTFAPVSISLQNDECAVDDSGSPMLHVVYSIGADSITLLGSDSATLGDVLILQEEALDITEVSAGEVGEIATLAVITVL